MLLESNKNTKKMSSKNKSRRTMNKYSNRKKFNLKRLSINKRIYLKHPEIRKVSSKDQTSGD